MLYNIFLGIKTVSYYQEAYIDDERIVREVFLG
jgi:hypothetical protein